MISFIGTSFAPTHLKAAAIKRGFQVTDDYTKADLVFVSEDTPTWLGRRDVSYIRNILRGITTRGVLVLTSQVYPGFTRSLGRPIYHMAETLRVKDAEERALHPEQFIIGCEFPERPLPTALLNYVAPFNCPVFRMTWEEAEFAKIAINMTLAAQVDSANRLSKLAEKLEVDWDVIKTVLKHDRRIGKYSYLEPGDWKKSSHLLRDYVTVQDLEK